MTDGARGKWQVLVPEPVDETGPDSIRDIAEVAYADDYPDEAAMVADLDRFDAVVVRTFRLDRDRLERAARLKVIAKHGVGLDNVDIEAATERGVVVCNTPAVNSRAVAEHAITLVLGVRKCLPAADRHVRSGGWDRAAYLAREVGGDTLGLFGCGDIGATTAALAAGLGMDVLFYDPYLPDEAAPGSAQRVQAAAELFERADAVSVHAPLTGETRGAVGADELRRLGPEGVIVNTSRGGVVDEAALVEALEAGTIAGAGIDVYEEEPPPDGHPLFGFENVLLTPHMAGSSVEAMRAMSTGAAANIRAVYEGRLPDSTVNADGLDPPGGTR